MHTPVLLGEVISALKPAEGEVFVDATFGGGGYTKAILESANCKVIALDRDATVLPKVQEFKQKYGERFNFFLTPFSAIANFVTKPVNGIVADFGVSSMQLDEAARGFSFLKEAPLNMQMGAGCTKTAREVVNNASQPELERIIKEYGEEGLYKKIASFIVRERAKTPIETTTQLANLVTLAYGKKAGFTKIHPATKTFQAIRIYVNDELKEIERLLEATPNLLIPAGRLVTVAFHSLEDGLVKSFLGHHSAAKQKVNKYASFSKNSVEEGQEKAHFTQMQKTVEVTKEEAKANPRARSAKMRLAVKI